MRKDFVILTISSKHGGYCVAGLDAETGVWARLVSSDEKTHGALSRKDIRYKDGSFCKPCDRVSINIKGPFPTANQPENVLVETRQYWEKRGRYRIEEILSLHAPEDHTYLFGNTKTYITESEIADIRHSLALVRVMGLTIHQTTNIFGSPKTKASFQYKGNRYFISVTDPVCYTIPDQTRFNEAMIVLSLPESPFPDDKYFKFIAWVHPL